MFAKEGHHLLPPERIAEWRRLGRLPFFHYADNAERMLNFAFYEDSLRYNPFDAAFPQPTLVFQGLHDTSVDPRTVEAFARTRPNVTLSLARGRSSVDEEPAPYLGGRLGVSGVDVNERWLARSNEATLDALCVWLCLVSSSWPGRPLAPQRAADATPIELRVGFARPGGGYTVQTTPARNLHRPRARRRGGARKPAGRARGAGDHHPHVCAGQSRSSSRRRLRSLRRDALPGRAHGHAGDHPRGAGDGRPGADAERRHRAGVLQRVVRRAHRDSIERLARRRRSALSAVSRRRCVRRGAGVGGGAPRRRICCAPFAPPAFAATSFATADRVAQQFGPRGPLARGRPDPGRNLRAGSARRRRPDARLAAHQEHDVRAALAGDRVPVHRPRVWPRRRPVRHRLDEPRRARRRARPPFFRSTFRGRHRGRRIAVLSAPAVRRARLASRRRRRRAGGRSRG